MSFAYLRVLQQGDVYSVVELIAMTPVEGVPPRPTPGPNPPDGGNGGPVDPGYSPPWAQVPGSGPGTLAYTYPAPEGVTPPTEVPAGFTAKVMREKGSDGPSWVYVGPHLQHNK